MLIDVLLIASKLKDKPAVVANRLMPLRKALGED